MSVVNPDGSVARTPTAVEGVDTPLMVHDMALTQHYIVLMLCPLVFDIAAVLTGGPCSTGGPRTARGSR